MGFRRFADGKNRKICKQPAPVRKTLCKIACSSLKNPLKTLRINLKISLGKEETNAYHI